MLSNATNSTSTLKAPTKTTPITEMPGLPARVDKLDVGDDNCS